MVQLGEVIFSNIFYFEILYRAKVQTLHYRYFITNTHLFYFNLDFFFTILGFDLSFSRTVLLWIMHFFCSYTVKKICRFFGKIPGIWLPVLLPFFLRAFTCRTFLEIKIW